MRDLSLYTMLLVEDEIINALLIKLILEDSRINIITAVDGQDALDKYNDNKNKINIILLDIHMPLFNGYQVYDMIRKTNKDIIIIAQTANAEDKEYCMSIGFNDFIAKPIDIKRLESTICKFL